MVPYVFNEYRVHCRIAPLTIGSIYHVKDVFSILVANVGGFLIDVCQYILRQST